MMARSSGVLLPLFSLPSPFGIGDMGPGAFKFIDFLRQAGQVIWQILPLNPTIPAFGYSPYHGTSNFAFNPMLISPEILVEDGFLRKKDLSEFGSRRFEPNRVQYYRAWQHKRGILNMAFERFYKKGDNPGFLQFCADNRPWLDDFAMFTAFKAYFGNDSWRAWPVKIRTREETSLKRLSEKLKRDIHRARFFQYLFAIQWQHLKAYANAHCVLMFGDLPIYVPYESADVWSHPELFKLDARFRPIGISGVPPDYFSKTGQLWGHPVYRWKIHQNTRYEWWFQRIAHHLALFDYLRIDHFRGLVAYWQVPFGEKTAVKGRWHETPADDFFLQMSRRFAALPIVAEDLGYITPDVREVLHRYGFPGMRVLVFGFSGNPAENPNAPHNTIENTVVYTGTHDTNTVRGWFDTETSRSEKDRLFAYLGRTAASREVSWELIRLALMSPARLAILPVQDLLGLDASARINRPDRAKKNWLWRLSPEQMAHLPVLRLKNATETYGRN